MCPLPRNDDNDENPFVRLNNDENPFVLAVFPLTRIWAMEEEKTWMPLPNEATEEEKARRIVATASRITAVDDGIACPTVATATATCLLAAVVACPCHPQHCLNM